MEKQVQHTAMIAVNNEIQIVHNLYDRYSGMLLGYILEVVKNREKAEECLAAVFKELPCHLDEIRSSHLSEYCFLQGLIRKKMGMHADRKPTMSNTLQLNKYLNLLGDDHRKVFYGLHYQCKTTSALASELNKSEEVIRIILKEAFTIIRKGHRS